MALFSLPWGYLDSCPSLPVPLNPFSLKLTCQLHQVDRLWQPAGLVMGRAERHRVGGRLASLLVEAILPEPGSVARMPRYSQGMI